MKASLLEKDQQTARLKEVRQPVCLSLAVSQRVHELLPHRYPSVVSFLIMHLVMLF